MRHASSDVIANGFSERTWAPDSSAALICSRWTFGGVATTTASRPYLSASRQSFVA